MKITIKYYNGQYCEHTTKNYLWDISSLSDHHNQDKNWEKFSIIYGSPWITLNGMWINLRMFWWHISMLFRTWWSKEYNWGEIKKMILFRNDLKWCFWQQTESSYMLPPWKHYTLTQIIFRITLMIWRLSNSRYIQGRILYISVLKPIIMITSSKPITSFRIILILYFVAGKFRSTRRLRILLINFLCMTRIVYKLGSLFATSTLWNRLCMNTRTL